MIVKNEEKIILRCLESVKDWIDYYVICDTGSTDNTVNIIKNYFDSHNIDGIIHNEKWVNFGFNRTEALKKSKNMADYILLIDADMQLRIKDKEFKTKLTEVMYNVEQESGQFFYSNIRLIKGNLDYEYVGVTHEFIRCTTSNKLASILEGVDMLDFADGCNRKDKFQRDISLLQNALKEKTLSPELKKRYYFYLAQSYRDLGKREKAIKYYLERAKLGGWNEEVFYSYYQVGEMYLKDKNIEKATYYLLKSFETRPERVEGLYKLVHYYVENQNYEVANIYLLRCLKTKYPDKDLLFIDSAVYNYLIEAELAIICCHLGEKTLGRISTESLMHRLKAPFELKQLMINNMWNYSTNLVASCKSFKFKEYNINTQEKHHNILNPSICQSQDGKYLLNIREVNYTYNLKTNKYEHPEEKIMTFNRSFSLSIDEIINHEDKLSLDCGYVKDESDITKYNSPILGYEDLRIFYLNNIPFAVATCIETNTEKINEMVLLHFTPNFEVIQKVVRLKCENITNDKKCEKNWIPLIRDNELYFIYSCEPTVILKCDIETGICESIIVNKNNLDLSTYRGGTQAIQIDDYWLFIIHQVGYANNKRCYYHRFVRMNEKFNIINMSPLFTFDRDEKDEQIIEFASGLAYNEEHKKLIITYGVNDKKCFIGTVDLNDVNDFRL